MVNVKAAAYQAVASHPLSTVRHYSIPCEQRVYLVVSRFRIKVVDFAVQAERRTANNAETRRLHRKLCF